ncbi:hypothetical protein [Enterovirga aerilata]|uniref:Uncharacterized protein n=1 Tax=Enterovirga aerilata TaxID=2730920 RepID=A0A849I5I4_9HYPH|nr:hypothetical protein [Enterovirga sp. DB1703]NNM72591.1 hypothetical protein [Enterovirga sp. DB1703]
MGRSVATAVLLASFAPQGATASDGVAARVLRLAQAAGDDSAWRALEAEQERRRRARERSSPTLGDPAAAAPTQPRAAGQGRVDPRREVKRREPKPEPVRARRSVLREAPEPRPRRAAPARSAAAPAPLAAAPRISPAAERARSCYAAVGIPADAAGRPLRDPATAGERSQEAFIRCVDRR